MAFVESAAICLEPAQYDAYLTIRNWPRTFLHYLEGRRAELLGQKADLHARMQGEIDDVFARIAEFRAGIAEAVEQGLTEKELSYDDEDLDLASLGEGSQAEGSSGAAEEEEEADEDADEDDARKVAEEQRKESAEGKTFPWLGRLIGREHQVFSPAVIEEVFAKVDALKQAYDEVEQATALINKRETLLGVPKTQFTELRQVQDELKPLHQLWRVAYRFGRTLPAWVEGRFDQLDAAQVESRVEEWTAELKRLQKTPLVAEHPR